VLAESKGMSVVVSVPVVVPVSVVLSKGVGVGGGGNLFAILRFEGVFPQSGTALAYMHNCSFAKPTSLSLNTTEIKSPNLRITQQPHFRQENPRH
jgi:hypothetical protein